VAFEEGRFVLHQLDLHVLVVRLDLGLEPIQWIIFGRNLREKTESG
jgi:hypothetical protein